MLLDLGHCSNVRNNAIKILVMLLLNSAVEKIHFLKSVTSANGRARVKRTGFATKKKS